MALDKKQSGFGFNMEERFQKQDYTHTDTHEYTHTDTHAYTPNRKVKERKTERMQLLAKPSTKERLLKYVDDHNTSINDFVMRLIESMLESEGY